ASEWTISFGRKKGNKKKKRKKRSVFKATKIHREPKFTAILNEYAAANDEFKPVPFLKEFYRNDKRRYYQMSSLQGSKDQLLEYYFENAESVMLLDKYLPVRSADHFSFHNYFIEDILGNMANLLNLNSTRPLYTFFAVLSTKIYAVQTKTTTLKNVQHLFGKYVTAVKLSDISLLSPVLIKRGNWYEFLNTGMLYFFFLEWMLKANKHDYAEMLRDLSGETAKGKHDLIALAERYHLLRDQD
ncbi:MAG TPA: hypothetical protein VGC08_12375, partial [Pedobacter sp.]